MYLQHRGTVSVNWTLNFHSEVYLSIAHKDRVWRSTGSSYQNPFDLFYMFSEENHHKPIMLRPY